MAHLCGAGTRAGNPCKRGAMANGRCPNHGGKSTGPKTEEGRRRCAEAVRARWQRLRLASALETDRERQARLHRTSGWG